MNETSRTTTSTSPPIVAAWRSRGCSRRPRTHHDSRVAADPGGASSWPTSAARRDQQHPGRGGNRRAAGSTRRCRRARPGHVEVDAVSAASSCWRPTNRGCALGDEHCITGVHQRAACRQLPQSTNTLARRSPARPRRWKPSPRRTSSASRRRRNWRFQAGRGGDWDAGINRRPGCCLAGAFVAAGSAVLGCCLLAGRPSRSSSGWLLLPVAPRPALLLFETLMIASSWPSTSSTRYVGEPGELLHLHGTTSARCFLVSLPLDRA